MEKECRLVRTPKLKIPIGKAVRDSDGRYGLMIKKAKRKETEFVAVDELVSMVVHKAEGTV